MGQIARPSYTSPTKKRIRSRGTRFVFVEDDDDVDFYSAIYDVLSDDRQIEPAPSLVFLAASIGSGRGKVAGGMSRVVQWVEKFDQRPLNEIFLGVIDLDSGNKPSDARVQVLGRYSFENYLLDPLVLYGLLIDEQRAPAVADVKIIQGAEHRIHLLEQAQLQAIVDTVVTTVEPRLSSLKPDEQKRRDVHFPSGIKLTYPAWMLDRQGHGLLQVYQGLFGGPQAVTPPGLLKMMRRVRMIPKELVDLMRGLQHT